MPRGDGTGPMGMGSMTGRGVGFCTGYSTPGYANPVGYNCGFGIGRGRGLRRMYYTAALPRWSRYSYPGYYGPDGADYDEKEALNRQADYLEEQLQQVRRRLSDFKEND